MQYPTLLAENRTEALTQTQSDKAIRLLLDKRNFDKYQDVFCRIIRYQIIGHVLISRGIQAGQLWKIFLQTEVVSQVNGKASFRLGMAEIGTLTVSDEQAVLVMCIGLFEWLQYV